MYKVTKTKDNRYAVKKTGGSRASKIFNNKSDAEEYCDLKNEIKDNTSFKTLKSSKLKKVIGVILMVFGITLGTGTGVYVASNTKDSKTNLSKLDATEGVVYEDFQMHFLELGNSYAGDSTYIKAGDVDILIDAGSRKSSATTIKEYVDKYCTDGKLEYVISTHAHQDHIAGFVGTGSGNSRTGILYQYEIGTLIDFALTNQTSQLYSDYLDAVEYAVANGAKHYNASECFNEANGAKKEYTLSDTATMKILYNEYYFTESSDENNYSVCTLFTHKGESTEHNFLLTGDLEKEGEESLAEYYNGSTSELTLPHCDVFKGGHHGSKTSSNDCLLSLITPDICCVCCCAGTTEYTKNRVNTFPTQEFINRIAKYTDAVYITSMWNEETNAFESMNGNIIVSCEKDNLALASTNNLTKLKDTEWFSHIVYVDSDDKIVDSNTSGAIATPCRTIPNEWR